MAKLWHGLPIKWLDQEVDPCFSCRLCKLKPYDAEGTRVLDESDGSTPPRPLGWITHTLCHLCGSVLDDGYRFDCAPGCKYEDAANKPGALIKLIERDDPGLEVFGDRRTTYIGTKSSVARPQTFACSSMSRGQHVCVGQQNALDDTLCEYDWWPQSTYTSVFGADAAADPTKLGHVKIPRHGAAGVAIFLRPPGVVRVKCREVSSTDKVTCVAGTVNNKEVLADEINAAFTIGAAAFKQVTKQCDEARQKVQNERYATSQDLTDVKHALVCLEKVVRTLVSVVGDGGGGGGRAGGGDDDVCSVMSGMTALAVPGARPLKPPVPLFAAAAGGTRVGGAGKPRAAKGGVGSSTDPCSDDELQMQDSDEEVDLLETIASSDASSDVAAQAFAEQRRMLGVASEKQGPGPKRGAGRGAGTISRLRSIDKTRLVTSI